ncbi:phage head closure protein [Aquamicrobium segne]|uniref:Phage head closure protein n=1 Tax=Aquamicrobium segne TaxID=469547 RepID=A0ABW0H1D3_9HYPH
MTSREPYRPQRIGNLRERIVLGKYVPGEPDWSGHPGDPTWEAQPAIWARVEPLKGEERMIGGGLAAVAWVQVHIRHRSDVETTWRLTHRGITYNIRAIRNLDERDRFLSIDCEGLVNED